MGAVAERTCLRYIISGAGGGGELEVAFVMDVGHEWAEIPYFFFIFFSPPGHSPAPWAPEAAPLLFVGCCLICFGGWEMCVLPAGLMASVSSFPVRRELCCHVPWGRMLHG